MKRMLLLNMLPLVSLLAVLILGFAAQAQDPSRQGRAILQKFCARCHAIDKVGNSPRPTAPPFRELSNSFDLDQFSRQLERGLISVHPDMPEFKFSIDDAHAVNVYLRSIQK